MLDQMQSRLDANPQAMKVRRSTVEHPFGTIKAWMDATHFLCRGLAKVSAEMSLHVLAYNLKRVMKIMGTSQPDCGATRLISGRTCRQLIFVRDQARSGRRSRDQFSHSLSQEPRFAAVQTVSARSVSNPSQRSRYKAGPLALSKLDSIALNLSCTVVGSLSASAH